MKHARQTVADAQAGQLIIAAEVEARVAIFGILITFTTTQSPRLENTADGTEIVTFRPGALSAAIFIPPRRVLWQSKKGSGVQIDTATADPGFGGTVEVDIWYDYLEGDRDVFVV